MRRPISPKPSEANLPGMFNTLAQLKSPTAVAGCGPSEQKPRMQGWWKLLLSVSCIGFVFYIISQDFSSTAEEKRMVRGKPGNRMVTVVMNTFKRQDYMTRML